MPGPEPIPLIIRTRLAHAALQAIADECGADILHIKGAAVDPSLLPQREDAPPNATAEQRSIPRVSADADVLVRPQHMRRFQRSMKRNRWTQHTHFASGAAVEHSTDWRHDQIGQADIHVRFPGIQEPPRDAFEELWRNRRTIQLAHYPCSVPTVLAMRLLLLLHAARAQGTREGDKRLAWEGATPHEQREIVRLAQELQAEAALAAATGNLEKFTGSTDYELWRLFQSREKVPSLTMLRAIIQSKPTPWLRLSAAMRIPTWAAYVILARFEAKHDQCRKGSQQPPKLLGDSCHDPN